MSEHLKVVSHGRNRYAHATLAKAFVRIQNRRK